MRLANYGAEMPLAVQRTFADLPLNPKITCHTG